MANQSKNQKSKDQDTYNTPIDASQRHTGIHEKGDSKQEDQPESGSNAGPEGAPNQGTEKR